MNITEQETVRFPTPGVEPGPAGWKPAILTVRPRGIRKPRNEPVTHSVQCPSESLSLHIFLLVSEPASLSISIPVNITVYQLRFYCIQNTTQTMTCPSGIKNDPRAIINAAKTITGLSHLFTLWTSHVTHHHGLVRFQVSDRKLVKHTTEMILWSMILTHHNFHQDPTKCDNKNVLPSCSSFLKISIAIGKIKLCSRVIVNLKKKITTVLLLTFTVQDNLMWKPPIADVNN